MKCNPPRACSKEEINVLFKESASRLSNKVNNGFVITSTMQEINLQENFEMKNPIRRLLDVQEKLNEISMETKQTQKQH